MAKNTYSVLLVDDSEDDRLFMRRAILGNARLTLVGELHDGEAAVDYLEGKGPYRDRKKHPFPDAMLLDLKMPRKTGHEVLEWMRDKLSTKVYVAIVSGSFLPEDIERCRVLGANAYYQKKALREELIQMLEEIARTLDKA